MPGRHGDATGTRSHLRGAGDRGAGGEGKISRAGVTGNVVHPK
ncbi:hypothetical protein [Actinophytocola sp.]|nr:hypothetical protein [Actinophytocola sp.]HYQ68972.1 hypothetical protein [Actinophytocola sp.]